MLSSKTGAVAPTIVGQLSQVKATAVASRNKGTLHGNRFQIKWYHYVKLIWHCIWRSFVYGNSGFDSKNNWWLVSHLSGEDLCHSINAGSVVGILWGSGNTLNPASCKRIFLNFLHSHRQLGHKNFGYDCLCPSHLVKLYQLFLTMGTS